MRQILIVMAVLLSLGVSSARAAEGVANQIQAAIGAGNYAAVASLVNANPSQAGPAVIALLQSMLPQDGPPATPGTLASDPGQAAQAAQMAAQLSPSVGAESAAQIAALIRLATQQIAAAGVPCAETPPSPVCRAMTDLASLAATPSIVAADPPLVAWIQAEGSGLGVDAQLAQQQGWNSNDRGLGGGQPPPSPPRAHFASGD